MSDTVTEIKNKRRWYHIPLMPIVFIISWLYIITLLSFFNIMANSFWLIKMFILGTFSEKRKELKNIAAGIKTIADVEREYKLYKYVYDGITKDGVFGKWPTWIPLPIVFLAKNRQDNCDGSYAWLRWLMKQFKKNNKNAARFKYERKIYVPIMPWKLDKVHYIGVVTDLNSTIENAYKCYSSGKITSELYDQLALRLLQGDQRYIWID